MKYGSWNLTRLRRQVPLRMPCQPSRMRPLSKFLWHTAHTHCAHKDKMHRRQLARRQQDLWPYFLPRGRREQGRVWDIVHSLVEDQAPAVSHAQWPCQMHLRIRPTDRWLQARCWRIWWRARRKRMPSYCPNLVGMICYHGLHPVEVSPRGHTLWGLGSPQRHPPLCK